MANRKELLATECGYNSTDIDYKLQTMFTTLSVAVTGMEVRYEHEKAQGCSFNAPRVHHGIIGLTTEIGELRDAYKKHWFYGKELDSDNVAEEVGDIIWYLELLKDEINGVNVKSNFAMTMKIEVVEKAVNDIIDYLGLTYDGCAEAVIRKLKVRYPDSFTKDDAVNRDTVAEMEAFTEETPKKKGRKKK